SRTQTPHVNITEMAKDKQIFLPSDLQRRSSWTDSEEEEEPNQINPMVPPKVSTQSMINNAIQTQVPERRPQMVTTFTQQRLTVQMPPNIEFQGAWPVRSQAYLEQERAQERRTVSIIELQWRLRAAEQEDRELSQEENPISHQSQLRERRENRQRQSDRYWKAADPDQLALDRAIALTNRISDCAARTDEQNPIYYHDNTEEEQMVETEKEVSALEARKKHRRDNLDKENETRSLEKQRIELTRTLRKDYIDSNPTLKVDRKNPRSPRPPSYIEQSIALEVDERLPLPNQVNNMQDAMLINTTISPQRINFNQDSGPRLNLIYPPPEFANNNQLSFFEQLVINNRNTAHLPLQPTEPANPERDMLQLRFEQDVHDTVFGELDCFSDLNNNEMDKQSQSKDSEEARDPLSIKGDKEKHMEMDKQDKNQNAAKAKVSLTKEKQQEKEMDKQSQSDDSQEFGITRAKKKRGRHKRGKKTKVEQPRKERNLNNMNEDQTRNLRSGTKIFLQKPQVNKERKQTPNKSKVLQDNHTPHPTQPKGELLTPKSIRVGLNVDSGMSNHPALRLKQFSLGSISSQLPPSLDTNGTRQQNGEPSSSKFQTLDSLMLSTQDGGKKLQGGTYFQGGIAERVSDHVLLNSKSLQDGTNLEEAQQKRSQTELSSYETMNVDSVPPSTQGQHAFTQSMYDASSQQHDMIHDQNLISAGNTFLSQQTMENVDSPSTLLQGSLAGTGGTLGHGLEQCSESSPHNVAGEGS
ncbi:MAG: hypothetical protein EZS28_025985, partial [Streblomastix strix]